MYIYHEHCIMILCIIDDIWMRNNFLETYMSIWSRICIPVYKKVCQGSLSRNISIYYFKNSIKRYPKWRECIFSNETPKSFWGPKAGPRPHAEKGSLRSHNAAVHRRQFRTVTIWGPPLDQILDPPLIYYLTWSFVSVAKICQFQFLDPPPHTH